jgi:Mg2+/Co2+ transporter CorC
VRNEDRRDIVREAFIVPESKLVADLFYSFRKRKLSLAIIVDEYGGVTGLVTMEDLLECIFGEILSPSELLRERAINQQRTGKHEHRIDGAMTIGQFNRLLGSNLSSDSAETVGGLLLHAFGEIPQENSHIVVGEHEFEVVSVAGQRIAEVTVRPVPTVETPPTSAAPAEVTDRQGPPTSQNVSPAEE